MRLQKYISDSGVCSRRKAEELIAAGRVTVNGETAHLGVTIDRDRDTVAVDGVPVIMSGERTYIMLHKPVGYVTTMHDERGRPTVAELVADTGKRLYPVGRLDIMSEGLLILTDDGETANCLAHPSHGVKKTYRVWVRGEEIAEKAALLAGPLTYRDVRYSGGRVDILRLSAHRGKLDLTISEGKNREVRNMCSAVGLQVERLIRIRQGELSLGNLPVGKWRPLTGREIKWLQSLQ